jgi:non-specific serine/threonine protein kinase
LRLLVTSREPLHVRVESVYAVPPLGVPNLDVRLAPAEVEAVPAVDLFLRRARAAGATFELSQATVRDLAELCVRLDGLPLAIELAAARARLLTPREMLARLGRQVELLRSHEADRTPRHRSLGAAVGWSYDLLSDRERHAFQCLAVFAGGCSLDAADAVLAEPDALDLVASLIDKSLVRNEPGPGGETRLRMLETIRAFGAEQLGASNDASAARDRHAAYFLSLVKPSHWDALDLPTPEWLAMVDLEHDNLRAALRWSIESGDRRACLELATSLQGFWMAVGYLREGVHWLEQALALAEGLDQQVEAIAHHAAGQLAWRQGDYDGAARHYADGLALRRALGDPFGIAVALQGLASVARDRGDVYEAIVIWEECVSVFRASGNRVRVARATLNLAIALHLAGQSERAATLLEEAAALASQIGQHWANATASTYLGLIALEVWHAPARAASHTRHALTLAPRVGDTWVTAHVLELVAWLAVQSHDSLGSAAQLFGAAEALRERSGARLHPAFRAGHERWLARLQDAAETAVVEAAWQYGATAPTNDMPRLAMAVVRAAEHAPSSPHTVAQTDTRVLSAREREIAALVAHGLTSRQIADQLIVGERTVETHVDHIRAKLGVRSRAQIAAWAVERGLVALHP